MTKQGEIHLDLAAVIELVECAEASIKYDCKCDFYPDACDGCDTNALKQAIARVKGEPE